MMESKNWWKSKTLWTNFVLLLGLFLSAKFKVDLGTEEQAAIIVIINVILRIITKGPLGWNPGEKGFLMIERTRISRSLFHFLAVFFVFTLLLSCASLKKNTYNTLLATATTYETTMVSVADLHAQGLISDEEKDKIIKYAQVYWAAYHSAVLALEVYDKVGDTTTETRLLMALSELSRASAELLVYLEPLLIRRE